MFYVFVFEENNDQTAEVWVFGTFEIIPHKPL